MSLIGAAILIGKGIAIASVSAVALTAIADTPVGKAIGGAAKTVGKTVGKVAKGLWGAAKKIPVIGGAFKGIEWAAKKVARIPGAIWGVAKKTPVIGRLCNIAEEMFYGFKARFNKGFTELRALIAKIKAKLVELLFKVLKTLNKETQQNGKTAVKEIRKEKKEAMKAKNKSREAPSHERAKSVTRSEPEAAKTAVKRESPAVTAAKREKPIVTTDISQKINSAKGMAVPGGAAPIIAAGKGIGQKAIETNKANR